MKRARRKLTPDFKKQQRTLECGTPVPLWNIFYLFHATQGPKVEYERINFQPTSGTRL